MTRRFMDKLIRIMLGLGLLGSSVFAVSFFNGCEGDEARRVRILEAAEEL